MSPTSSSASFTANISASPDPNGGDYTVSWSNPGELEYDLQQSFNGGNWTIITSTSWHVSHDFVDKPPGNYTYRMQYAEVRCTGFPEPTCSPYTNYSETTDVTVLQPPPVPTGLTAPVNDYNGSYPVSWDGSSGATSYELEETPSSGNIEIYSVSGPSKSITGNPPGSYSYRVMACEQANVCSNWSSAVTVTVVAPPAKPTGLSGPGADHNGSFTLSWNESARSTSYRLQEKSDTISWRQIHSGEANVKPVSGRSPGTWYYRVKGCNVESVCSGWSATVTVNVAEPPETPVLTGPDTSTSGDYTVSWNDSAGSSSFEFEEKPEGGDWELTYTGEGLSKPYVGMPPGTYSYRVRGCNVESVCSGWSATHAVEVPEPPPPVTTWLPTDATDFPDAAVFTPFVPAGDTGTNSVGAVRGSGGVSGGSAAYQVAVAVPPGRKGMQPNVSLSYSSSSGSGVVGVGWSLNAGSSISRCPATPVHDGFSAAVQYDAVRDRLCLDGRRLVVVNGAYGQSGAEYRTELDIFARITQHGPLNGSTTSFTVEFKDGRTSRFGSTAASRHTAAGRTEVLTWAIRETRDRSGNTITYDYQNVGNGEHLLAAIHYTGILGSDGDRHVRFSYEDRGDYRTSYLAGGKTRSTKRLETIRTEYQTTLIREYTLDYGAKSASTGRSLLRSIEECAYVNGFEAHCLPPTEFGWQERATQFEAERLKFSNPDNHALPGTVFVDGDKVIVHSDKRWLHDVMPHGDANGDGVKDWTDLFVNAEGEITEDPRASQLANCFKRPNAWTLTCLEADFDADGLTDSFRKSNDRLEVRLAEESTWFNTGIVWDTSGAAGLADTLLSFADFNGDGWVDIAFKQNAKLWIYFHTRNTNSPYSATQRQWLLDYPLAASGMSHRIDVQAYGDMDGNGTPDLVVSDIPDANSPPGIPVPAYIVLTESLPGGTMSTSTRPVPTSGNQTINANFFHDVNGDGLADVVTIQPGSFTLGYRLNDGTGFPGTWIDLGVGIPTRNGLYEQTAGEPAPYVYPVMSKVLVMDYDGDGREEILFAGTVLASGCSEVWEVDGQSWKCDDELYGEYQALSFTSYQSPINGDVKDNSVRRYSAHKFVENANGTISATTFPTDIEAAAAQTAVVDATGDGLPDVVTVLGCRLEACQFNTETSGVVDPKYVAGAWINRNLGAAAPGDPENRYEGYDLMNAVEDGLGVRNEWTYRPLSSDEYDADSSAYYETERFYVQDDPDYFHFASSMYVVADHRASNGVGGLNSTKYRYRGAIFNNKGRGFQGFKTIIVEEDFYDAGEPQASTDKITRTDFHQKWPLSSIVEQSCTWIATNSVADDNPNCSNVLSHSTVNQIHNAVTSGSARLVAVKTQTDKVYDLASGLELSTSTTDRSFDAWGNITWESRSHRDAWTTDLTETMRSYSPDEIGWWPDKLNSKTVTHNPVSQGHAGGPPIAAGSDGLKQVTTAFNEYDLTHRLPTNVTVSANDTALTQTVTTVYNEVGLPTYIETSGPNITGPRTVDRTYTDNGVTQSVNGYFPFTATNTLGHVARRESDPAHGQPTRVTDPNGLVATTAYDAFGRPSEIKPPGQPTQSVRYHWCSSVTCPAGAEYRVATYAAGSPEKHRYADRLGREVQSSVRNFADTSFISVRLAFDARGHKTFESQPYDAMAGESDLIGTRYLSYDALGRLQSKEQDQANGFVFLTTYSYAGLTISINASGLLMHRIYNGLEQLVETQDAMGGFTRYAYDGAGNPIAMQDPNGHTITAAFNALGQKLWVDDPNMGLKNFSYNALGEVLSELDANGDTLGMDYDVLGRLIERRANGVLIGTWVYDNGTANKGIGLLDYEDNHAGSGLRKHYFYSDAATGRKALTRTVHRFYEGSPTSGTDYETRYYTDSYFGRSKGIRYPGGVGIGFVYNAGGYLLQEKDASSSYVLQQISARDSRNRVIQATLANSAMTHTAEYYAASGQMRSITVSGSAGTVHALDYLYDTFGNLESQSTTYAGAVSSESFYYDDLHRLIQSNRTTPAGVATVNYAYDASGNLTLKDDYATAYDYIGAGGPNAVASITKVGGGTVTFGYDANGNMTQGDGKTLTYNAHNLPVAITADGITATFAYGADLARYRQDKDSGETTLYIDKLMEIVQVGSAVDYRHYLGEVAILTKTGDLSDPAPGVKFLLRDRLGSVVTITDEQGVIDEVRGYDPFGKPRDGDWADKIPPVLGSAITDRGFTDHEHLDESELIHMNGRAYDYNLGRFLSVDPIIQAPGNSQSLNPYSYIMNNPLAGTDPSGYASCSDAGDTCNVASKDVEDSVSKTVTVTTTGSHIAQRVTATAVSSNHIHLTGGNGAAQAAVAGALKGINQTLNQAAISEIGALSERDSVGGGDRGDTRSPTEVDSGHSQTDQPINNVAPVPRRPTTNGGRRRAAREARSARGSTTMPDLEPGAYPVIVDSLSVTAFAGVAEIGDIWVIDNQNRQVLHFGTAGGGPAAGIGAIVSRQFGAVYLNEAGDLEGFSITGQSDGAIGLGGSGSLFTPVPLNPENTSFTGGPSIGFGASLSRIANYTWFKKVYTFEEAPGIVPLQD